MDKYIDLGEIPVSATISYSSVLNVYKISLWVGDVYVILNNNFKEEEDAYKFLWDYFNYIKE